METKSEDDKYFQRRILENIEGENSESEAFDKGILLLNTGAIGASLLLLGNIFSNPVLASILFLLGAWTSFAISSTANVVSHAASVKSYRVERKILEKRRLGNAPADAKWYEVWKWRFDIFLVNWLNRISLIMYVAGVASLLWFGYLNIQEMTK